MEREIDKWIVGWTEKEDQVESGRKEEDEGGNMGRDSIN